MRWFFRDISDDPSEKELTQKDQFNNDEVVLAEALVRETIQNSSDAPAQPGQPVTVRFALANVDAGAPTALFHKMLDGLAPHLRACGIDPPDTPVRLLVIEDFGTTGLQGSIETKDNGQFSGFWRRFGRSNKQGGKLGRWGLGKLVFTSSSEIHTVIGLTRRLGEDRSWLMGQAVLKNHTLGEDEKDSVGFWCRDNAKRPGLPADNPELCDEFCTAAKLHRTKEPGLSLIVPWVLPEISQQHLTASVLQNYYFPILTDRLVVHVGDTAINSETFDSVAAALPPGLIAPELLEFVRAIENRRLEKPDLILPDGWHKTSLEQILQPEELIALRTRFTDGELAMLRAPLTLKQKGEAAVRSWIDLFLRYAPGQRAHTLVVRGSITVPGEGKKMALPDSMAALVADQEPISRLLGDAENPAHTSWNARAEKLRDGWESGSTVLAQVRQAVRFVYDAVAARIERDDPYALVDFFSIPKPEKSVPRPDRPTDNPPDEIPPPRPKPFQIVHRENGFAVLPGQGLTQENLPDKISVRVAYDIFAGNPFKRFSDFDFSFFGDEIRLEKSNATFSRPAPNELEISPTAPDFKVEATGFDPNRDLIIEAWS